MMRPIALIVLLLALVHAGTVAGESCAAPRPVCAAVDSVYAIQSAFEPAASAVLVAPGRLVTNRHVVADESAVTVRRPDGGSVPGRVVATDYPGDLVLIEVSNLGTAPLAPADEAEAPLYVIGVDLDAEGRPVRVFAPGAVIVHAAPGYPLARLHHDAESRPGTSGGALVDARGRLVAVAASGGEGRNAAIPAREIARLKDRSAAAHAAASRRIGVAYRDCIEGVEAAPPVPAGDALMDLRAACLASENPAMIAWLGRVLGQAGDHQESAALFQAALARDPNDPNVLHGLAVTYHLAEEWSKGATVLARLLDIVPDDFPILRLAIQAGKFAGDQGLTDKALALLSAHHPDAVEPARDFLAQ